MDEIITPVSSQSPHVQEVKRFTPAKTVSGDTGENAKKTEDNNTFAKKTVSKSEYAITENGSNGYAERNSKLAEKRSFIRIKTRPGKRVTKKRKNTITNAFPKK